jgi:hypothetical protein
MRGAVQHPVTVTGSRVNGERPGRLAGACCIPRWARGTPEWLMHVRELGHNMIIVTVCVELRARAAARAPGPSGSGARL